MKWFKHDTDANRDPKLEKVLMRYGAEGYALYWLCIELIAAPIDKHNLSFELEHDAEILAHRLRMDSAKVEEIMLFMTGLELFELEASTQRITCLKLANRIENSIVKNPEIKQIQYVMQSDCPGQSRTIPDNSGKVRPDIDQIQIRDKKAPNGAMSGKPDAAKRILEFLNEKTGRNYRAVASNLKPIQARMAEGYTEDECRMVVAQRCRKWATDDKMAEYLRPATLFNATKFNQYAGELAHA